MRDIVLASSNTGKVNEYLKLFSENNLDDWNILNVGSMELCSESREDGSTFEENAVQKSRHYLTKLSYPVLADDSGLCVTCLHDGPGVFSARWAGPDCTDEQRCTRLLELMHQSGCADRSASFACCIAVTMLDGISYTFQGICSGKIADIPAGSNGFGYDSIFVPSGYQSTMAQMTSNTKNHISHRAKAFRYLSEWLQLPYVEDRFALISRI